MNLNLYEIKKLQVRAIRGNQEAQQSLIRVSDNIAKLVNQRLRELERRGYDYYAYNTPIHFTQTMYDSNRFAKSKTLDYDWYMMGTQSQIGWKFLQMRSSTVQGMKEIEEERYQSFIDREIIDPSETSRRKFRNFLKWMGQNDEVGAMTEAWSTSETMIEMMVDAYNRKANTRKKMTAAYSQYLSGKKTFNETMKSLGINPINYASRNRR